MFRNLSPSILDFYSIKSLKFSFTLNYVLKRANDFIHVTISNWPVLLSTWVRNLKPFRVSRNRSRTRQTHSRDIINILLSSGAFHSAKYSGNFGWGSKWNRHFPEFDSVILDVPRVVGLKFCKIGITKKFRSTRPFLRGPSFSERGNRTQHGWSSSFSISVLDMFSIWQTTYCSGLATTSCSNYCANTCKLRETTVGSEQLASSFESDSWTRQKNKEVYRTLNVVADSF